MNDEDADARALGSHDSQSSDEVASAPEPNADEGEDEDARALGSRDSQSANEVDPASEANLAEGDVSEPSEYGLVAFKSTATRTRQRITIRSAESLDLCLALPRA